MQPGFRNEFHARLQQAVGKNVVVSGEYIWKYTHNAFDFSILGNTPITFPIDWHNSKIPGYALHVEVPNYHTSAPILSLPRWPLASSRRRWPAPEPPAASPQARSPFRSASTTTRNSTKPRTSSTRSPTMAVGCNGMWGGFNWRYRLGPGRRFDALLWRHRSSRSGAMNPPNSPCGNSTTTLPDGVTRCHCHGRQRRPAQPGHQQCAPSPDR